MLPGRFFVLILNWITFWWEKNVSVISSTENMRDFFQFFETNGFWIHLGRRRKTIFYPPWQTFKTTVAPNSTHSVPSPPVRSRVVVPDTKKFPTVTILDGKLVRARASHRDPSLLNNNDCLYDNLVSFSPLFAALTTSVGQILDQWVDGTWVKNAARQSRKADQTIKCFIPTRLRSTFGIESSTTSSLRAALKIVWAFELLLN